MYLLNNTDDSGRAPEALNTDSSYGRHCDAYHNRYCSRPWSRSIDLVDVGSTDADSSHLHQDNEEVPNPAEVHSP